MKDSDLYTMARFCAIKGATLAQLKEAVANNLLTVAKRGDSTLVVWDSLAEKYEPSTIQRTYNPRGMFMKRIFEWKLYDHQGNWAAISDDGRKLVGRDFDDMKEQCRVNSTRMKRHRSNSPGKGKYIYFTKEELSVLLSLVPDITILSHIRKKIGRANNALRDKD